MKRRKFSCKSSIQATATAAVTTMTDNTNSKNKYDQSCNRLSLLNDDSKAFVRAGQVIGTLSRAIEELVRNAIIHGKASDVDVTIGSVKTLRHGGTTTILEVRDNGTGIDVQSTQKWIGVKHCSSYSINNGNSNSTNNNIARNNHDMDNGSKYVHESLKGETLKSLAALSIEFRLSTASLALEKSKERQKMNKVQYQSKTYAPLKSRKRKFQNFCCRDEERECSEVTVCEKVITDGKHVSFKQYTSKSIESPFASSTSPTISNRQSGTGTKIQVYGLFHGFAVRKRQYEIHSKSTQDASKDRVILHQAQNCLKIIAMAFPRVSIRLFGDPVSNKVNTSWCSIHTNNTRSQDVSLLAMNKDCIRHRLLQLCGERTVSECSLVHIDFTEGRKSLKGKHPKKISQSIVTTPGGYWSIQGALCCKKIDEGNIERSMDESSTRSRQQELIFVNGKLCKQNNALADLIQKFSTTIPSVWSVSSFLLYVTCPPNDVEVILDESTSYSYVTQRSRLEVLIIESLKSRLIDNGEYYHPKNFIATHSKTSSTANKSLRLVYSEQISTSKNTLRKEDSSFDKGHFFPESPFTSAFIEDSTIDWKNDFLEATSKYDEVKYVAGSSQSYQNKKDLSSESDNKEDLQDTNNGMQWTRTRVKALESKIRTLANTNENGMKVGISISKSMLSSAKFIAQLDHKFIVVRMNGILCAIDQHAADERIGLEQLEKALYRKILNDGNDEKFFLSLSKKENISSDDLIKYVPLQHPKLIHLSISQLQTIKRHLKALHKWKFNFTLRKGTPQMTLIGVPGICDKVASPKDFIQFLQAIERRSADVSLVKPAFVKRALAIYACRYAIMFGDVLSSDQCIKMISDLSKCDMSFMCAHGRPSEVPLLDLNTIEASIINTAHDKKGCGHHNNSNVPLRFQKHRR